MSSLDTGMRDWSQLADDLIINIAKRLEIVEDFVSFISVCRSWRIATPQNCWTPGPRQFPWLISAIKDDNDDSSVGFFSLNRNKRYASSLPEIHGKRCWGSSLGWLVILGRNQELQLFNPLTRTLVDLPSLHTLGIRNYGYCDYWLYRTNFLTKPLYYWLYRTNFLTKALVVKKSSKSGNQIDNIIVVLLFQRPESPLFASPGDQNWTTIPLASDFYRDIATYQNRIFAVTLSGGLFVLDISDSNGSPAIVDLCITRPTLKKNSVSWKNYLVESAGDLWLVTRYKDYDEYMDDVGGVWKTVSFEFHKLNLESKIWEKMKQFEGDDAVFVGDNCSMTNNSNHLGSRRKYIYFTDDSHHSWMNLESGKSHWDMGIYDGEDGSIKPIYIGDDSGSSISPPVWMMPCF